MLNDKKIVKSAKKYDLVSHNKWAAMYQKAEYYYKNSTQYISQFYYGEDGRFSPGARVECLIISKKEQEKYNTFSTLEVIIQFNDEFGRWLESGDAY